MRNVLLVLFCALSVGLVGCQTRVADATLISTKNMDIKKSLHRVDSTARVCGEDKCEVILIYQSKPAISMKQAIDDALHQRKGCVGLADAVVTYKYDGIPPFFYTVSYIVEGNPVFEVEK